MKSLRQGVNEYLEYRWKLGFQLQHVKSYLLDFVSFMEKNQAKHITTELALAFSTTNPNVQSRNHTARLSAIRQFAIYWSAMDPKTEIPSKHLLPYAYNRRAPYIYTDAEIIQLLECYESNRHPMDQYSFFVIFGLLAVTGMRITEVLSLDCADVDLQNGVITIRQSKFRKSRHIPIHKSTVKALKEFSDYRNQYFVHPVSSHFFLNRKGKGLNHQIVRKVFHQRLMKIDIAKPKEHCRSPRIMDLRHSFAVKTLLRWYKQGVASIDSQIYLLSTYLGHVMPSNTYWYLTVTPELLKFVVSRCEQHAKED